MRIDWTEVALPDLAAIHAYIAKDSPHFGKRLVEKVLTAVESLADFPHVGRRVPEAERDDIRERIFQSYRIIDAVEVERILILALLHGRRDLTQRETKPWDVA